MLSEFISSLYSELESLFPTLKIVLVKLKGVKQKIIPKEIKIIIFDFTSDFIVISLLSKDIIYQIICMLIPFIYI